MIQPTPTSCGQTCVAMIVGMQPRDVIALFGEQRTTPKQVREMLDELGFSMAPRSECRLPDMPSDGLWMVFGQTIIGHKLHGHWFVYDERGFFCPSKGEWLSGLIPMWTGRFYRVETRHF